MSRKRPYYPIDIRRNKSWYFELTNRNDGPFIIINVYYLNGKFHQTVNDTKIGWTKNTYQPQPDELAKFMLIKEEAPH